MSARGFGSVVWAGAVAGAALGFYLVSLRVASERASLENVESRIALTQRDIRLLQTEIGTRGRLAQLERWNVKFMRLSAPNADQFVDGGFQLATLVKPMAKPAIEAPVVLASASIQPSADQPKPTGGAIEPEAAPRASRPVNEMMYVASYTVSERVAAAPHFGPKPAPSKPTIAKPATKPVKTAMADPLAPLSAVKAKAKATAPAANAGGGSLKRRPKDSDSD